MRARMFGVVVLVAVAACAHGGIKGAPPETLESAYVKARLPQAGCRDGDLACCVERARAARAAVSAGETARAAALWDGVALACPTQRDAAGAAVRAASGRGPAGASPSGRVLNVNYRTRLSPAIRLFWVSTVLGPRLLPAAASTGSTQPLQVEVHAIRFSGGKGGPLLTAIRQLDVALDEGTVVTVEIAEAEGSDAADLAIRAQVERLPPPRAPAAAAAPPPRELPPPLLEKARLVRMDPPRVPLEFGSLLQGLRPAVRVCLDRMGDVDTVRFLEQVHPRLAASVMDMLRDSQHTPYRVDKVAVPSCGAL